MTFTPHGGGGKPEIFAEIHACPGLEDETHRT